MFCLKITRLCMSNDIRVLHRTSTPVSCACLSHPSTDFLAPDTSPVILTTSTRGHCPTTMEIYKLLAHVTNTHIFSGGDGPIR